jgi:hypothetical protein
MAIRESLKKGFEHKVVNGDSKVAIDSLSGRNLNLYWEMTSDVSWIQHATRGFQSCRFVHVRKAIDQTVDWLANRAIAHKCDKYLSLRDL